MPRRGALHIGTSGWHYKHWRGLFYPERLPSSGWLEYYFQQFDTVEVNNSFYRLPPESAFHAWRDSTPAGFCFAVKGSRFLTHMKKLKDPEPGLANFLPRVELLGPKLGAVLFQLPPFWEVNLERLELFLHALPRRHLYAFELRNPTWHTEAVYAVLRAYHAAFCIFDLAGFETEPVLTADFTYIRLHGPGGKYQGSYSDDALSGWADRIRNWRTRLRAIYVYFDNDQAAYAPANARRLQEFCR